MSVFEAWALPSVRHADIRAAIKSRGLVWDSCAHVAATRSLQNAIACSGRAAVPIEALIDLIVMQVPRGSTSALSIEAFPSQGVLDSEGPCQYLSQMRSWSRRANGIRTRIGLRFDDELRRLRQEHRECEKQLRMLVEGRREFRFNVKALIEAGTTPRLGDFQAGISLPEAAWSAWAAIERAIPELHAVRDDLWDTGVADAGEVRPALLSQVKAAMEQAFPIAESGRDRWLVVHHGFHFYTPPQWALFQLLKDSGCVDQVFIVHDDGRNPCFEVWRRFFGPGADKWKMPIPNRVGDAREPAGAAAALLSAWAGEKVEPAGSAITLTGFQNIAEFVRDYRLDFVDGDRDGNRGDTDASRRCCGGDPRRPRVFGADPKTLQRHVDRLSPLGGGGNPNLLSLPVGVFLTRLHECIDVSQEGTVSYRLTPERLRDIVASGFLDIATGSEQCVLAAQRAGPFFSNLDRLEDWRARAAHLQRLVMDAATLLPPRVDGVTDRARLEAAARNPLRLVPWADLSVDDVAAVRQAIEAIAGALESIGGSARVSFADHQRCVSEYLRQGLAEVPEENRRAFMDRLDGFRLAPDGEVGVDGLIDVMRVLLGGEVDFDDADEFQDRSHQGGIGPLRSLDALGYEPAAGKVHVANLSDAAFPGYSQPLGWPFQELGFGKLGTPVVSCELLEARAANAAPDGLYLIWLALIGAGPDGVVQLSWIKELDGEYRNASPLLLSLAKIGPRSTEAIDARVGGIEISPPRSSPGAVMSLPIPCVPLPVEPPEALVAAVQQLPVSIASSAVACPRRFALQWALGPSGAFTAPHHQLMLCGNVAGALARGGPDLPALDRALVQSICNDWWRHHQIGERRSSRRYRVIKPEAALPDWKWVFTLGGGRDRRDAISLAYQAASGRAAPDPEWFGAGLASWLPPPSTEPRHEVCKQCPMRGRCLHEVEEMDSPE